MKPIFCHTGSKRTLIKKILPLIPKHEIYVEPFIGGGAIYFAKEPSNYEVINDLDSKLIKAYKLTKTIKSRDFRQNLNSIPKITRFLNEGSKKQVDVLTDYIIRKCNGFAGIIITDTVYQSSNPYLKLKNIDEYQERLKHTKILNKSYEKIIKEYDSPDTFFYLDPPYEHSEGLYNDFGIDYEQMRNLLDNIKGKFLLSINDSPYIRKVFKGFKMKGFTLKPVGNAGIGGNPRKELLIKNY